MGPMGADRFRGPGRRSSPAAPGASGRASPGGSCGPGPGSWCAAGPSPRTPPGCRPRTAGPRPSSAPTCGTRTRRRRLIAAAVDRFGRVDVVVSNAGGVPAGGRRHRVAAVSRQGHRAEPDRAAARGAGRQRGDAGPAGRRVDHHDRQRQRHPAVARHRRLRRGQGRPAQPGHQPGRGVGAEGAGQLRGAGPRGDRVAGRGTTAARPASPRWPRPCRCAGWRRRRTWPAPACSWPRPLASYVSGAALLLHGGGERPAFLAALGSSVYPPNE